MIKESTLFSNWDKKIIVIPQHAILTLKMISKSPSKAKFSRLIVCAVFKKTFFTDLPSEKNGKTNKNK